MPLFISSKKKKKESEKKKRKGERGGALCSRKRKKGANLADRGEKGVLEAEPQSGRKKKRPGFLGGRGRGGFP